MRRLLLLSPLLILFVACATPHLDAPANAPWPVNPPQLEASSVQAPVRISLDALAREVLANAPKPLVEGNLKQKAIPKPSAPKPAAAVAPVTASGSKITEEAHLQSPCTGALNCMQQKISSATTEFASRASQLAKNIGETNLPPVDADVAYKVFLQDIKISMNGQAFTAVATLDFAVSAHVQAGNHDVPLASCGINEPMPRIEVTLPGSMQWLPDAALGVKTGQLTIRWIKPCTMTALALDMESMLNLPLLRTKINNVINDEVRKSVQRIDLKPVLAQNWPKLQSPQSLSSSVWLTLRPEAMNLGVISGAQNQLETAISITARPRIDSADKAPATAASAPPAIGMAQIGNGFHIALESHISLQKLDQLLNEQLANKPLTANGHTVLIKTLRMYGNEDRAVICLTLDEPIKGEIYVMARPVFDASNNTLHFDKLDYSLATHDLLAKSASWLLSDTVKSKIAENTRLRFDEDLPKLLGNLRNLNIPLGNSISLQGTLDKIQPATFYFTQDAAHAHLIADGKLEIRMSDAAASK
jgi:hypothetical protein